MFKKINFNQINKNGISLVSRQKKLQEKASDQNKRSFNTTVDIDMSKLKRSIQGPLSP